MEAVRIVQEHWLLAGTFVCFFWPALLIFSPVYIPPLVLYSFYAKYKSVKTGHANRITSVDRIRGAQHITTKKPVVALEIGFAPLTGGSVLPSAHAQESEWTNEGTTGTAFEKGLPTPQETRSEQATVEANTAVDDEDQGEPTNVKGVAKDITSEKGQIKESAAAEGAHVAKEHEAPKVVVSTPIQTAAKNPALEKVAGRSVVTLPLNEPRLNKSNAAVRPAADSASEMQSSVIGEIPLNQKQSLEDKKTAKPIKVQPSPGEAEVPTAWKKPVEEVSGAVGKDHPQEVKQSIGEKQVKAEPVPTQNEHAPVKASHTVVRSDPAHDPSSAPTPSTSSSSKEGKCNTLGGTEPKADHKSKSKKKKKSHSNK